jgi:alkylation response protein AidB-like acyl-CoA dehydrogenase
VSPSPRGRQQDRPDVSDGPDGWHLVAPRTVSGMELGLTDDQRAIQEVFAAFFSKEAPPSVARAAEPLGFDRSLWQRLLETGAPGMSAPESAGGGGAGLSDLSVVAEALGRAIAPVPLVEHAVASRVLPDADIVAGEAIATIALRPAGTDGVWRIVPAGAVADVVIGLDGDELVAVRSEAPGDGPRNHGSAPLADRSARAGDRTVLGGATEFARAVDEWKVLTAATLVGIAGAALDMGVEYVLARHQFGVPVGSFQAVQHGLADLPASIDGARLLMFKAAWAGDGGGNGSLDVDFDDIDDFATLASMAYLFASDAATHATDRSLHYHGGYGFSEEYDIQLYYRRARGWSLVLDSPTNEALRLADRLLGPATTTAIAKGA